MSENDMLAQILKNRTLSIIVYVFGSVICAGPLIYFGIVLLIDPLFGIPLLATGLLFLGVFVWSIIKVLQEGPPFRGAGIKFKRLKNSEIENLNHEFYISHKDLKSKLFLMKSKGPVCIVCKQPINIGEIVSRCIHCGVLSHEKHILEYVNNVASDCIYCKKNLLTKSAEFKNIAKHSSLEEETE